MKKEDMKKEPVKKEEKVVTKKEEEKEENKAWKTTKVVLNVIFWVAIVGLAIIWLIDFIRVQQEEHPIFCIEEKTHVFEDGTVDECVGLGYKVYEYHRSSISNGRQFGPFFIKMAE